MTNSLPPVSHHDFARIVSRLHVSESFLSACRYSISRLQNGRKGWLSLAKSSRRYVIAATIQHHTENRVMYDAVQFCKSGVFKPRYFFDKSNGGVVIKD